MHRVGVCLRVMRAAVYHGRKDIRVEDVSPRGIGTTDVRIDVTACGICGSDLHEYTSGPMFIPSGRKHPVTNDALPLVLGHEFSGVVTECGDGVGDIQPGDTVAVNPVLYCDECRYCAKGAYHLCENSGFIGLATDGGFAEQAIVPAESIVKLPESVDPAAGALVEPLSVAVHAVRQSGLQLGDTVAVFGTGPIGLAVVQAARAAGARRVIVSEPQNERRLLAAEVGADVTINPMDEDAVDIIRSEIGVGADIAFEVAGIEQTFNQAIRSTRKDGTISVVSIFEDEVTMPPQTAIPGERSVVGTLAYHGGPRAKDDFGRTLDLLARGDFTPEAFITDRIPLDDIVERGFVPLTSGDEHVKILVEP